MKKRAAEGVALGVRGVRAVADELAVKLSSSDERTDDDIARAAKHALESSFEVPESVRLSVEGRSSRYAVRSSGSANGKRRSARCATSSASRE